MVVYKAKRSNKVEHSGASSSNCQQCVRTMTTYAKRNKVNIEVLDMSQLVARSLGPHASEAKRMAASAAEAASGH